MRIIQIRLIPLLLLIILIGGCSNLSTAQTINRVTLAERSDGLGYVLRFHATALPDSFRLVQSSPETIQAIFYGRSMRMSNSTHGTRKPVESLRFHDIPSAIGVDIELEKGSRFLARMYEDANGKDVLIGLTRVSQREIETLTAGLRPILWSDFFPAPVVADEPPVIEGSPSQPSAPSEPYTRSTIKFDTIIIDAGHGGRDPGAIGTRGTYEKTVALSVSKKLGAYINEHLPELKVVYTRENDTYVGLAERGRIANRKQGDLFISIHTNSHRLRQPHGAEFYFLGMNRTQAALEVSKRENSVIQFEDNGNSTELSEDQLLIYELSNSGYMESSRRFAELLDKQFSQRAQRRSRGVKQAGLQVLWEASMPGVLIELGFISNPDEEQFMTSEYGQNILASAIFRALREYKEMNERSTNNRNSSR